MTPEAQRIALAEACGWTEIRLYYPAYNSVEKDEPPIGMLNGEESELPDYLGSLDAIAGAEKALLTTIQLESNYIIQLQSVCMADEPRNTFREAFRSAYRATAPQRCEALLRTIGKWEE